MSGKMMCSGRMTVSAPRGVWLLQRPGQHCACQVACGGQALDLRPHCRSADSARLVSADGGMHWFRDCVPY